MTQDRRTDKPDNAPRQDLRGAIRQARIEDAERSEALAELKGAEIVRLELLQEALAPVLAQIPREAEMFDCGLVPGVRPRLFIDMIAHVEMGHDKRLYRFVQSRRNGRAILAEHDRVDPMVDAITAYIARRLIDREKALAGIEVQPAGAATGNRAPERAIRERPRRRWLGTILELLLSYLGIVALCVLIVVLARYAYDHWPNIGR